MAVNMLANAIAQGGHLTAGRTPSWWVVALFVAVAALALVEAGALLRVWIAGKRPMGRVIAAALRLGALTCVAGLVFEVSWQSASSAGSGERVAVLLDASASMGIADQVDEASAPVARSERARRLWERTQVAPAWSRNADRFRFDRELAPLGGAVFPEANGHASDLAGALQTLRDKTPDKRMPYGAVVVVSDGLVAQDDSADAHLLALAHELNVPLTTVSTGGSLVKDAAVATVRAGEFAFVENVAEFEADIVAFGLSGVPAQVRLVRDGQEITRKTVYLRGDGEVRTVRFDVAPDRTGQFVYGIDVVPLEDEATLANNRRLFAVRVLRDKVRILHVAGRPSWDVRALRTLLRRDPNVELLSYYILRDFDDIAREDVTAPLSLIPFPTQELFREELGSFDIVILHNFDAMPHNVGQYLDDIAQYVNQGGALVMIGGDLAFSDGGYAGSDMRFVLPVRPQELGEALHEPFQPRLTDDGRDHPITAWLGRRRTDDPWNELPELDHLNLLPLQEVQGATALLNHPSAQDRSGAPIPVLSVATPGEGRVTMLSSFATWRLGFAPMLQLIEGSRPYDLLWLGIVRWSLHDEASGRLVVETDKTRYSEQDTIDITVRTLDARYQEEPNVMVRWRLERIDDPAPTRHGGTLSTQDHGRQTISLPTLPTGAYAVTAQRQDQDPPLETRRVFLVEPQTDELASIAAPPGMARLRMLARETGGLFIDAANSNAALPSELPSRPIPTATADPVTHAHGLWTLWLPLGALVLLGAEWLVRRRWAALL